VSEGRDRPLIAALAEAVESAGATLLDVHADVDHNRSVFTFLGPPATVSAAALALARLAVARVDVRARRGVHPRIGVVDVIPLVPLRGARMADAVRAAHGLGAAIGAELEVPVFYFGAAARVPERRELPAVRRGQFETLAERMRAPGGAPDAGPHRPHPTAGATAVGARGVLIAFNAVLDTAALDVARDIARAVRASSGGLPAVRALGVPLASRGRAQVTMNLLNFRVTSIAAAMAAVEAEARRRGVGVQEYELVGCAPEAALRGVDRGRVRITAAQLLADGLLGPDSLT
jgi:glutamate formiminotransferase